MRELAWSAASAATCEPTSGGWGGESAEGARHDDDDDDDEVAAATGVPAARTRGLACIPVRVDDGADRGGSIGSGAGDECDGAAVKAIVVAAMRAGKCGASGGAGAGAASKTEARALRAARPTSCAVGGVAPNRPPTLRGADMME